MSPPTVVPVQIGSKTLHVSGGICHRCGFPMHPHGAVGWRPGTRGHLDREGQMVVCILGHCGRCDHRQALHLNCDHMEAVSGTA